MLLKPCAVKDRFFFAFVKYNENKLLENEVKNQTYIVQAQIFYYLIQQT